LVLNSGSSSIKFALFDVAAMARPALAGNIMGLGSAPTFGARDGQGQPLAGQLSIGLSNHANALTWLFDWLSAQGVPQLSAAGHRVVHGGEHFTAPVCVTPAIEAQLAALAPLAPLHQPHNLAAIHALRKLQPALPQAACFDTAFHRTQPEMAQRYALPAELTAGGVRRYGFHGLSYEYIAGELPAHLGDRASGRVIVAHLGNGASLCAQRDRRSLATTMGFSTLDGLMMGTRCGSIDPGVLLYLLQEKAYTTRKLEDLLYRNSGLLGMSGISSDVRDLLASNAPAAREALDLFCYRVVREIGSLIAALGGLDALVFTAGIGEHASELRAHICKPLEWLGLELDEAANRANAPAISTPGSRVTTLVIPTNEEAVIAHHTARVLGLSATSPCATAAC
jgi:acetate kinase